MHPRLSRFGVGLVLLVLLGTGCHTSNDPLSDPTKPASTASFAITPSPSVSAPAPTPSRPSTTRTTSAAPSAVVPPTLTPGPAIALWYLSAGHLYRYSLHDWVAEPLSLLANEFIHSAVLSPAGNKLVYSSDIGMGFTDMASGEGRLLFEHVVTATEIIQHRFYEPLSWSTDGEWLWIGVQYGEGYRHLAASVSHPVSQYFNCYTEMQWSPDQARFFALVSYSGLAGCGDQDGAYVVDLDGGQFTESRLFHQSSASPAWERQWRYLALGPTGQDLAFVLQVASGSTIESSLLHITTSGEKRSELAHSQGRLVTPLWSRTGETLYFVEQTETTSTLFAANTNTLQKAALYSSQQLEYLLSLSPDGQWLVLGSQKTPRHWQNLRLLHINGTVAQVIRLDTEAPTPLVGWESSQ